MYKLAVVRRSHEALVNVLEGRLVTSFPQLRTMRGASCCRFNQVALGALILERDMVLCEVDNLNEPKTLLRTVKS